MLINKQPYSPQFNGTTKVYSMSDTHQETRKTRAFLSEILRETDGKNNALLLHSGDIFKGIYPRGLERDSYIAMKKANPDLKIVMTLGNNDFGFNKASLNYLIDTTKRFNDNGIDVVCANIFESSGKRPEWIKPYTVVERDGDRNFVTGFCIDNINTAKYGIVAKKQVEVIDEIKDAILKEKPDNVIFLNHDYMPVSQELVKTCKEKGIKVDLVIGGHDHEFVEPDLKSNIYYPAAFANSMYKMDLVKTRNKHSVDNVQVIKPDELNVSSPFVDTLDKYEKGSGLLNVVAPLTLHLPKRYSEPCPLGSFLADNMKSVSGSDVAFFSTGFLTNPMKYVPNSYITNYSFRKAMNAETPIKTAELDAGQLKEVFQNALKSNGYGSSNPKFLQCSNNVRVEGVDHPETSSWEVKQIYIDDEAILDENANPVSDKKFRCVMDSYIAEGGQGFATLAKLPKEDVIVDGEAVKINQVLMDALKEAPNKYEKGSTYPCFEIEEV